MTEGKFIVFEGTDGSGKTIQAGLLANYLRERGYRVLTTCEPTREGPIAERIRESLERKVPLDPLILQKLFTEDRREHLARVILPALARGEMVISDRYFYSTFAYGSLSVPMETLITLNQEFRRPDIAFFLDVGPDVSMARIRKRHASGEGHMPELFEQEEKLIRVLWAYRELAGRFPELKAIAGMRDLKEIHADIVSALHSLLEYSHP